MSEGPSPESPSDDASSGEAPRRRRGGVLLEIAETLLITVLLFFGIQTFLAQPFEVEQVSMQQTLQPGQYVLVDKLTPRFAPYRRGDIVVFQPPPAVARDAPFIKRVIGVAGDTVEIHDGLVHVNGLALAEPYVFDDSGDPGTDAIDRGSWTVAEGELFVLGDHRNRSDDSRVFGVIEVDRVVGRAFLRYWPATDAGILQAPSYPALDGRRSRGPTAASATDTP